MGTAVTFLILVGFSYGNAYVGLIGVRQRIRGGMRLRANDAGYYVPRHWGLEGFFRSLYINLAFTAATTALFTQVLPGESYPNGRILLLFRTFVNLMVAFAVALVVPSEFERVFHQERWRVRRVVIVGSLVLSVYSLTAVFVAAYLDWLHQA